MPLLATTQVNDTVGTLAGARYWDDDVMVAVILGTGTNACYIERTDAIPRLKGHISRSDKTVQTQKWSSNGRTFEFLPPCGECCFGFRFRLLTRSGGRSRTAFL